MHNCATSDSFQFSSTGSNCDSLDLLRTNNISVRFWTMQRLDVYIFECQSDFHSNGKIRKFVQKRPTWATVWIFWIVIPVSYFFFVVVVVWLKRFDGYVVRFKWLMWVRIWFDFPFSILIEFLGKSVTLKLMFFENIVGNISKVRFYLQRYSFRIDKRMNKMKNSLWILKKRKRKRKKIPYFCLVNLWLETELICFKSK